MNHNQNINILKYLRSCLADSVRMDINLDKCKKSPIGKKIFEDGFITTEHASRLLKKLSLLDEKNRNKDFVVKAQIAPISITPAYINAQSEKRKIDKPVFPLWIPCILKVSFRNNKYLVSFEVDEDILPWIPRNLLSPIQGNPKIIVADVDAVDIFLNSKGRKFTTEDTWKEYIKYAEKFLKEITGLSFKETIFDGCIVKKNYLLAVSTIGNTTKSILGAYDKLIVEENIPQLLENIIDINLPVNKVELETTSYFTQSNLHKGHATNKYPLADTQRRALMNFVACADGEIFACSGPPGTGKTTLIQNVLATLMVEQAINKKNAPVIICSSTNNQAVINIIESFNKIDVNDNSGLTDRWLPDVNSFGLYLPSNEAAKKVKDNDNIHVSKDLGEDSTSIDGFAKMLLDKKYIGKAKKVFIYNFNKYFNKNVTKIFEISNYLHEKLTEYSNELNRCPVLWDKRNKAVESLEDKRAFSKEQDNKLFHIEKKLLQVKNAFDELTMEKKELSFWVKALPFLPYAKKHFRMISKLILSKIDMPTLYCNSLFKLKKLLIEEKCSLSDKQKKYKNSINEVIEEIEVLSEDINKWDEWKKINGLLKDPPEMINELDTTLRYKMFYTAVHLFEAKYIVNAESYNPKQFSSAERFKRNVDIIANVTPCFFSTFHSNIRNFSYKTRDSDKNFYTLPAKEIADLIIVDEASQVIPDIAVVSFYFAKKAFIVGDIKQLEPVYSLIESIDNANLIKAGLINEPSKYSDMNSLGFTSTQGSIMKLAQKSCAYKLDDYSERGFLLTEHRRCPETIIQYCNELCYDGKLQPLKKDRGLNENDLPIFGFANIQADSVKKNCSRYNETEANIISEWIVRHKEDFEKKFSKSLAESLAIITPFNAQAKLLRDKLNKYGIEEVYSNNFKIGTVHSLQGAEREIIIFSPVYGVDDFGKNFFYNKNKSMLNVAVSRAKYSFIVFGCMSNFNPRESTPSGILAKYLFDKPENEITDISINIDTTAKDSIVIIDSYKQHIEHLKRTILCANEEVLITSPFISILAIEGKGITDCIRSIVTQGVKVIIFTDNYFDYNYGVHNKNSAMGHKALKSAGAEIIIKSGIHNKTLTMDKIKFSEGSFNWLSAVSNVNSKYHRLERTIVYTGSDAEKHIRNFKERMKCK